VFLTSYVKLRTFAVCLSLCFYVFSFSFSVLFVCYVSLTPLIIFHLLNFLSLCMFLLLFWMPLITSFTLLLCFVSLSAFCSFWFFGKLIFQFFCVFFLLLFCCFSIFNSLSFCLFVCLFVCLFCLVFCSTKLARADVKRRCNERKTERNETKKN
jgi:hypothetical protein